MPQGRRSQSRKNTPAQSAKKGDLTWRANHIADWRERCGLTQQQVADELAALGFDYTRVSYLRVEGGNQNPGIVILEAIVGIVGAPSVTAMTDYTPGQWASIQRFIDLGEAGRAKAIRLYEASE